MKRRNGVTLGYAGRAVAGAALCVTLGACGMSDISSPFSGSLFGSSKQSAEVTGSTTSRSSGGWSPTVTEANMLSAAQGGADVSGSGSGCPSFSTAPDGAAITMRPPKTPGLPGDMQTVMHRGEITQTARECAHGAKGVVVKYGFAGRVLLGPEGKPGTITLTVKLTIIDPTNRTIKTEPLKVAVTVAPGQTAGFFSFVREVVVPVTGGATPEMFKVYVGFDRSVPGAS